MGEIYSPTCASTPQSLVIVPHNLPVLSGYGWPRDRANGAEQCFRYLKRSAFAECDSNDCIQLKNRAIAELLARRSRIANQLHDFEHAQWDRAQSKQCQAFA